MYVHTWVKKYLNAIYANLVLLWNKILILIINPYTRLNFYDTCNTITMKCSFMYFFCKMFLLNKGTCMMKLILLIYRYFIFSDYTCVHCSKFRSQDINLLIHHGQICPSMYRPNPFKYKFVCFACGYFTYNRSNLVKHLRTHLGDKPFKCHICDYCSTQKVNLQSHLKTHGLDVLP